MIGNVLRRWAMLIALVVMWIALWGNLSIANIVGGTLVAVAVLAVAGPIQPAPVRNLDVVAAFRYLQTFVVQLLMASWEVIRAVVDPTRIKPGIVAMPLRHASDAVVTLVANSITLTPGTLTLETERRGDVAILYVHALDVSDADSVRRDIAELELRAVDAFAGPDTRALQARSLAELEERLEAEHPPGVVWPDDAAGDVAAAPRGEADAAPADAGGAGDDRAEARGAETDGEDDDRAEAGGGGHGHADAGSADAGGADDDRAVARGADDEKDPQ